MARLAIDIDGVLANFIRGVVDVANHIWPGRVPLDYQPSGWNMTDQFKPDEFQRVWDEINNTCNFWLSLDAYYEPVGSLASFLNSQTNHDVWLVTARSPVKGLTVARQSELWLSAVGVRTTSTNYVGIIDVKHAHAKKPLYRAMEIDLSIDDRGDAVLEYEELPNHRAALMNRPWNQTYKPKWRVNSMQDFLDEVPKG